MDARSTQNVETREGCDGSSACRAAVHIHGCFADNGENCDQRIEHIIDAMYHRRSLSRVPEGARNQTAGEHCDG